MHSRQLSIILVPAAWAALALVVLLAGCGGDEADRTSGTRAPANRANNAGAGGAAGKEQFGNAPTTGGVGSTATAGTSGISGAAGSAGSESCAEGTANTRPITPTVWLVLDGSGSMKEDFDRQTRWQALRAALMDPGGVVDTLQHSVRFGMVLYSGNEADDDTVLAPAECVQLVTVDPALDNYATLSAQYPAQELGGWTPTDRALDHVVTNLPVTNQAVLDAEPDPVYVILATDGAPNDRCDGGNNMRGGGGSQFDPVTAQRVLDVVGRGVDMGMKMFVVSLAGDDAELASHLDEVAKLGGTDHAPFVPSTKDDLVTAMQQIIGDATCQIGLEGSVVAGLECSGEVVLNGSPLACGAADGWKLSDPQTVQLTGTACSTFLQNDSQVRASFPCDAYSPD